MIIFKARNHFNRQESSITVVGAEEGFQGVTLNEQRNAFSIDGFIFVPLTIEKGASVGQWKIMISSTIPNAAQEELLEAVFNIR
jgi:hypothetical protein